MTRLSSLREKKQKKETRCQERKCFLAIKTWTPISRGLLGLHKPTEQKAEATRFFGKHLSLSESPFAELRWHDHVLSFFTKNSAAVKTAFVYSIVSLITAREHPDIFPTLRATTGSSMGWTSLVDLFYLCQTTTLYTSARVLYLKSLLINTVLRSASTRHWVCTSVAFGISFDIFRTQRNFKGDKLIMRQESHAFPF